MNAGGKGGNDPTRIAGQSDNTKRVSRRMALLRKAGLFQDLPPEVTVTRATDVDTLREAYHLVHEIFIEQGYIRPFPGNLRIRPFEALPDTATFVARTNGRIVSVQSLIPDNRRLGVPSDRAFGPELEKLRAEGRRFCEAANEAVAGEYRKTAIPTELMRCCFAHAMSTGCSDVVTAVSPGHAKFYGFMGFETITPVRSFSEMLEDPVVVVRFNFDTVRGRVAQANTQDTEDEAVFVDYYHDGNPYMGRVGPWSVLAERLFKDSISLRMLFDDQSNLLSRCNLNELRAIGEAWGERTFVEVIGQIGTAFCGKPQWRTSDSQQADVLRANTDDGEAANR